MAHPIMHLLIADKIYSNKSSNIQSYGDFLLGSIAPDAVHEKENYTREIKDISHYRFDKSSALGHFDTFMGEYAVPENRDFVLGYLVHLLSDMLWYHMVRVPFKEDFLSAPSQNMSKNQAYYADCDKLAQVLFEEKNVVRIIEGLGESSAFTLEGLVDADDVEAWRDKQIRAYQGRKQMAANTQYISEQHVRGYIERCADMCLEYLPIVSC